MQSRFFAPLCVLGIILFTPISRAQTRSQSEIREESRVLLEQLVRFADTLQTEVNLVRAAGYHVPRGNPAMLATVIPNSSWEAAFSTAVLQRGLPPGMGEDYSVSQQIHLFRMEAITLYDYWTQNFRPAPIVNSQWSKLNHAYYNAMSAVRWYIEVMRRSYFINNCAIRDPRLPKDHLLRRLVAVKFVANEAFALMHRLQHTRIMGFPQPRHCVHCAFGPIVTNVASPTSFAVQAFPYYVNGQIFAPPRPRSYNGHPAMYVPQFNQQYWDQRFTFQGNDSGNGAGNYSPSLPDPVSPDQIGPTTDYH